MQAIRKVAVGAIKGQVEKMKRSATQNSYANT